MKNQEISTLIGQKRAYNSSSFLLRFDNNRKNEEKSAKKANNIAILAPKKVFKTAVLRNNTRRRIKNAINKAIFNNSGKGYVGTQKSPLYGYNLVFSAKKGADTVDFKDLTDQIEQSLVNGGIIRL